MYTTCYGALDCSAHVFFFDFFNVKYTETPVLELGLPILTERRKASDLRRSGAGHRPLRCTPAEPGEVVYKGEGRGKGRCEKFETHGRVLSFRVYSMYGGMMHESFTE